jgi:hypothetical protein
MERLVAVWTRALAHEDDQGVALRRYVRLVESLSALCPFTDTVRVGLVTFPLRGPSRFLGGDEAVVAAAAATAREVLGHDAAIGVAAGQFGAFCAARTGVVVANDGDEVFRRALPIAALERRDLAAVCRRLGLHTVGAFADLEGARVAERFGADAIHAHRVARGLEGELRGQRDPALARRLRALSGDGTPREVQIGFFGDRHDAQRRAMAAAHLVRTRLGPDGVVTATVVGGRAYEDRVTLTPLGDATPDADADRAPWPGAMPAPAPATALRHPVAVQLRDGAGRAVAVDGHGLLTTPPVTFCVEPGAARAVRWFAGPWPTVERWWSARRRRAYVQLLAEDLAVLVYAESGRWWLAGIYD